MIKKFLLFVVLCLASVSVFAQGMRGGMAGFMNSPSFLLQRDDVKKDLDLTDEQKNKLAQERETFQTKGQQAREDAGSDRDAQFKAMGIVMEEANKEMVKILTPDQQGRLKEIVYQLAGFNAVAYDTELQGKLGLSDDQKSKIEQLNKTADAANQSVIDKLKTQDIEFADARVAFRKNSDAVKAGIESIMNADQKTKYVALQGKHFDAQPQPNFFGGRGN